MTMSRYASLRQGLEALANEFRANAPPLGALFHDLIRAPDDELLWPYNEYESFEKHNADDAKIELWSLWPSRRACSRFWSTDLGVTRYCDSFTLLAERGYVLFRELRDLKPAADHLPARF